MEAIPHGDPVHAPCEAEEGETKQHRLGLLRRHVVAGEGMGGGRCVGVKAGWIFVYVADSPKSQANE